MTKPNQHEILLGSVLQDVLIAASVLRSDCGCTGPELIVAAKLYVENRKNSTPTEEDWEIHGAILAKILTEREAQDAKWGLQVHSYSDWIVILGEEFGELCEAGIVILGEEFGELCEAVGETVLTHGMPNRKPSRGGLENMLKEAVQVAAVSTVIIEQLLKEIHNNDGDRSKVKD